MKISFFQNTNTLLPKHASEEENKDFRCCSTKQDGQSTRVRKDELQKIASCMQEAKFLKECGDTESYHALVQRMKTLRAELDALKTSVVAHVRHSPPSSDITGSTDDVGTNTAAADVDQDLLE
jgi:hypothetical protein